MEILQRTLPENLNEYAIKQTCVDCGSVLRVNLQDIVWYKAVDTPFFKYKCPVCGYVNDITGVRIPRKIQKRIMGE